MTKSEAREVARLIAFASHVADHNDVGILARAFSGLARATRTSRSRQSILAVAATFPHVAAHADFII